MTVEPVERVHVCRNGLPDQAPGRPHNVPGQAFEPAVDPLYIFRLQVLRVFHGEEEAGKILIPVPRMEEDQHRLPCRLQAAGCLYVVCQVQDALLSFRLQFYFLKINHIPNSPSCRRSLENLFTLFSLR